MATIGSGVLGGVGVEFPTLPLTSAVVLNTLWQVVPECDPRRGYHGPEIVSLVCAVAWMTWYTTVGGLSQVIMPRLPTTVTGMSLGRPSGHSLPLISCDVVSLYLVDGF